MTFRVGQTVVRRDVHNGSVWSAAPACVVDVHEGGSFTTALWPGTVMLASSTWIASLTTGDEASRRRGITNLASGSWELGEWSWRSTILLSRHAPQRWFSICAFVDAGTRQADGLYVNFERPYWATPIGFDTFDLLLDWVVRPDLSIEVKDRNEYILARELGIVGDQTCERVELAERDARRFVERQGSALMQSFGRLAHELDIGQPLSLPTSRRAVMTV